jgi:hypothetical protein
MGRGVLRSARIGVGLGSRSMAASTPARSDVGCPSLAAGRAQLAIPSRLLAIENWGGPRACPVPSRVRALGPAAKSSALRSHTYRNNPSFCHELWKREPRDPVPWRSSPATRSQLQFPRNPMKTIDTRRKRFFPSCILKSGSSVHPNAPLAAASRSGAPSIHENPTASAFAPGQPQAFITAKPNFVKMLCTHRTQS